MTFAALYPLLQAKCFACHGNDPDETLIVWCGGFGRTPDNGIRGGTQTIGRDHNAKVINVLFAGGSVKAA